MAEETSYIKEFLEEISETLNQLDRQFVVLEKNPSDKNCLAEIFRDLHTIKGSCGLLGLNKLESITHSGENLLGQLRDGKLALRPGMVDALLGMMDAVWKTVASLKKDDHEGNADYSALIETLARFEKGEPDDSAQNLIDTNPDAAILAEFLEEAHEILGLLDTQIVELESNPNSGDLISSLLRSFHTLKGNSGYMNFKKLETLTHAMENLLITLQEGTTTPKTSFFDCLLKMMDALRNILATLKANKKEGDVPVDTLVAEMAGLQKEVSVTPAPSSANNVDPAKKDDGAPSLDPKEDRSESANVRVNVDLLDSLMNLTGEVVLARNQFSRIIQNYDDTMIHGTSVSLNRVTSELQEVVMKARMQPIKNVWGKLPRMVRDLSLSCGNKARLEMEGQDSDLDKSLIMAIQDPLMNIIRNSIMHGIELPEERQSLGKTEEGIIRLRAYNQGGQIHIEVHDDGRGVDFLAIKNQAVDEKRITPEQAEHLSDKDCGKLLFMRGFSSTQHSLMKSAKGQGLTQTRELIEKIGGLLDIEVQPGQGTKLKIKIPLTLSIIPALIVSSGANRFAIPQINIRELIHLDGDNQHTEEIAGSKFYRLRDNLLPLIQLRQILGNDHQENSSELNLVVLQADDTPFGLVVDKIHNTEEIVVKTLESQLKNIDIYNGATIMGDGEIILILEVMGLAQNAQIISGKNSQDKLMESVSSSHKEDEETESMVIVSLGNDRRMAIRLADVARLEEIKRSDLEISGKVRVVQYRGEIMPLIDIPQVFHLENSLKETDDKFQVVVYIHEGKSLGLIVENIVDIVQGKINDKRALEGSNLMGTIITNDSVVDTMDVKSIVQNFLQTI
jgi:two-component system, chemotaxis family, sensor kinase CheA